MLTVLGITGPIFFIIAIGYTAVRRGLLGGKDARALGVFVIDFALPALLFKALSQRSLGQLLNLDLLIAYTLGSLAVVALVIAIACLVQRRGLQAASLLAMGMSLSNSAFMGFPIAEQLIGPAASATLAVYVTVENLIMVPLLIGLAELGRKSGSHWALVIHGIVMRLLRNPLILSILAGVTCAALELQLPLPLSRVIDLLSGASAPVALFYIGCTLAGLSLKGLAGDIGLIVLGKLLLHPLAVFAMLSFLSFDDPTLKQAAIINASMPMATIYPLLAQKYGQEGLCAAALVATTVVSFFTINGLLWLTHAG